jgi:hypothetical protein
MYRLEDEDGETKQLRDYRLGSTGISFPSVAG